MTTQYLELRPRIAPGQPERSALWRRIRSGGIDRMPPMGTVYLDPAAVVVREWIAGLSRCPPE